MLHKLSKNMDRKFLILGLILGITMMSMGSATDMPWEGPLEKILDSLTGPVAKIIATLAVAGTGLTMAFGEMGSAMKRMVSIVFGISIVFAAVTWVPQFFNFTGSALI